MSSHTNPSLCEFGYCHDPVEGSENQIGGTATCMSENSELVARKQGAHLADIKLEPALEGHEMSLLNLLKQILLMLKAQYHL